MTGKPIQMAKKTQTDAIFEAFAEDEADSTGSGADAVKMARNLQSKTISLLHERLEKAQIEKARRGVEARGGERTGGVQPPLTEDRNSTATSSAAACGCKPTSALPSLYDLFPLRGHATSASFDCFGYHLPAEALQRSVA